MTSGVLDFNVPHPAPQTSGRSKRIEWADRCPTLLLPAVLAGLFSWRSFSDPLARAEDATVEIKLVGQREIDPVLRIQLPGPHAMGLHGIDLTAQGVALAADVPYAWSAAILVDPDRLSRNPRSCASVIVESSATESVGAETAIELDLEPRKALLPGYRRDGLARTREAHPESIALGRALSAVLSSQSFRPEDSQSVQNCPGVP